MTGYTKTKGIAMTTSKGQTPKLSILEGKAIEDILKPKPVLYKIDDEHAIAVYPMSDGILMELGEVLERIISTLHATMGLLDLQKFEISALLAALPLVVKTCVPEVTKLVAAVTGASEESVAKWPVAAKIGILGAVIQAEDALLLLKNVNGLVALFGGLFTPAAVKASPPKQALENDGETKS